MLRVDRLLPIVIWPKGERIRKEIEKNRGGRTTIRQYLNNIGTRQRVQTLEETRPSEGWKVTEKFPTPPRRNIPRNCPARIYSRSLSTI